MLRLTSGSFERWTFCTNHDFFTCFPIDVNHIAVNKNTFETRALFPTNIRMLSFYVLVHWLLDIKKRHVYSYFLVIFDICEQTLRVYKFSTFLCCRPTIHYIIQCRNADDFEISLQLKLISTLPPPDIFVSF